MAYRKKLVAIYRNDSKEPKSNIIQHYGFNTIVYSSIYFRLLESCYNYLPVHVTPHQDYNWTICEELPLSCLSKIILKQYSF